MQLENKGEYHLGQNFTEFLYVTDTWYDDDTPTRFKEWRKVVALGGHLPASLPVELRRTSQACVYACANLQVAVSGGFADALDKENVPPPKTKLKTRWYRGGWQRFTSKGWTY